MSRWEREKRLDFIDDVLASGAAVRRASIIKVFGISMPQASLDIRDYLRLTKQVAYDKSAKCYRPTAKFKSVRASTPARQASWGT